MKRRIKVGEIIPKGWLRKELEENMSGCIGQLEDLIPDLTREHDLFATQRIGKRTEVRNVWDSTNSEAADMEHRWWNGETQGNWRDGYVRSAILLEDAAYLEKTRAFVNHILQYQDEGYLGIYDRELRFQHEGENAELWTQSVLFRTLLACYEGLGEERILQAVRAAADCVMDGYPMATSHPFRLHEPGGGVEHGLTIVDSFAWLYQITGEEKYLDYAVWLYEEYSASPDIRYNRDLMIANAEDPYYIFQGHMVHTAEHLRALIIAGYHRTRYRKTLDDHLRKLPYYLTPSGAPIGDEYVDGRTADSTWTGYEMCSLQELLHSYTMLAEESEDPFWSDQIEWLYYNAVEGMKHPEDSSIMYLKTDNCYIANGHRNPDEAYNWRTYKYSPTQRDIAVCCVPNMGRVTPYFVQSMLFAADNGFRLMGYGPYVYQGEYRGVPVRIEQKTQYPIQLRTVFHIKAEAPISFTVRLRLPAWAKRMRVNGTVYENPKNICSEISITQQWSDDTLEVEFDAEARGQTDLRMDVYVTYGPLVYALPLPAEEKQIGSYPIPGFCERYYTPTDRTLEHIQIKRLAYKDYGSFTPFRREEKDHWESLGLAGEFLHDGKPCRLELVPMARTILRKVTFKMKFD